jgi:hypothetical protein
LKKNVDIVLPSMTGPSKWSLSLRLSPPNPHIEESCMLHNLYLLLLLSSPCTVFCAVCGVYKYCALKKFILCLRKILGVICWKYGGTDFELGFKKFPRHVWLVLNEENNSFYYHTLYYCMKTCISPVLHLMTIWTVCSRPWKPVVRNLVCLCWF